MKQIIIFFLRSLATSKVMVRRSQLPYKVLLPIIAARPTTM